MGAFCVSLLQKKLVVQSSGKFVVLACVTAPFPINIFQLIPIIHMRYAMIMHLDFFDVRFVHAHQFIPLYCLFLRRTPDMDD